MMKEHRDIFIAYLFISLVVLGVIEGSLYLLPAIFMMVIWQL